MFHVSGIRIKKGAQNSGFESSNTEYWVASLLQPTLPIVYGNEMKYLAKKTLELCLTVCDSTF